VSKRNKWFVDYQDMGNGKGKRKLQGRTQLFKLEDFRNATVLDLGCNIGQMSKFAVTNGARYVLGVDYDSTAIEKATEIFKNNSKFEFRCGDVDEYFFWALIKDFDVSFLLSVIDTKELINRFGVLARTCMKTRKVMYFEGHNNQSYTKYMDYLQKYTNFTEIEYLGDTTDYVKRPFFRCSRKLYTLNEAKNKIVHIVKNTSEFKIAIVGEGASGKTFLKNMVKKELGRKGVKCRNVKIVDDLVKTAITNRIIYVDFRALLYYSNFDVVFNIVAPFKNRMRIRPQYRYNRSVPGLTPNVKKIYHVTNNNIANAI
jgi:SAM-dependent methyltransferase